MRSLAVIFPDAFCFSVACSPPPLNASCILFFNSFVFVLRLMRLLLRSAKVTPPTLKNKSTGCRMPDAGCQMPDAGYQMPDAGCRLPAGEAGIPDARCQIQDTGYRMPDTGCWIGSIIKN